jgi:hypothetical protein
MTDRKPITIAERTHAAWCELRPNPDGTLDELLANRVDIHIEQMDSGLWWMAIYKNDERQVVFFESQAPIHAWTEQDD